MLNPKTSFFVIVLLTSADEIVNDLLPCETLLLLYKVIVKVPDAAGYTSTELSTAALVVEKYIKFGPTPKAKFVVVSLIAPTVEFVPALV